MKVFETADINLVRTGRYSNTRYEFAEHRREWPNNRAKLAMEMVVKWGMVSGADDGEDSSGRSKLRLLSPNEVVDRAVACADLLMQEITERGWMIKSPSISELYAPEQDEDA